MLTGRRNAGFQHSATRTHTFIDSQSKGTRMSSRRSRWNLTIALALLADASLAGCADRWIECGGPIDPIYTLADEMTGTFSSAEQSAADPENYFNVRLVMTPIWFNRIDGKWFYVEQAIATSAAKPYRQRVYHVTAEADGTFHSAVFTLPGDPLRFSDGSGKPNAAFNEVTPETLKARDGCTVVLRAQPDGSFAGGTVGKDCPSDRQGAKYATSEITISENQIVSWDRGFDEAGKQVWGAEKGGYVFKRVK